MVAPHSPPVVRLPVALPLVFLGGAVGTLARHLLAELVSPVGGVPLTIGAVNVLGAFVLGLLLGGLRGGPLTGRPHLRLLVGTGLLGGFTTYSALAVDSVRLARDDAALTAAYGVGSVLLGLVAAASGVALTQRRRGRDRA
ncbi:CrcB protein [Nocardioides zeae]|uniref:CrcB protein n=1 Tax=Nocardioides zeae TaxID=1457234 RepID=A0ACC6IHW4_9ACTN|nr:CrcB family protein [Nocardioides zeae]MDR6176119.1 CrcB protein [Nocardioides zeae]MDR6210265.1 CrcB protein [Nocardioides zeae]